MDFSWLNDIPDIAWQRTTSQRSGEIKWTTVEFLEQSGCADTTDERWRDELDAWGLTQHRRYRQTTDSAGEPTVRIVADNLVGFDS